MNVADQTLWADRVVERARQYRIFSTLPYTKVPFWTRAVTTQRSPSLRNAHEYDLVLLNGGERRDLVYAAIAGMCPWIKTPHVIVDAHWQKGTGLKHKLQRLLLRMSRRLVKQVQVHSAEEVPLYHDIFGIPLATLIDIPYSTSLIGHAEVMPSHVAPEPPFILTGGMSFRDYEVFLAAAKLSGLRIKIGLPKAGVTDRIRWLALECPNVSLHTDWTNADYVHQMQLCRVFAMPIQQGMTRSTADQTILNAMHFGKVVVASDSIGPRIYIRDKLNGFLVKQATHVAWAWELKHAFHLEPAAYDSIGRRASYDARVEFNEPLRLARTLASAISVIKDET